MKFTLTVNNTERAHIIEKLNVIEEMYGEYMPNIKTDRDNPIPGTVEKDEYPGIVNTRTFTESGAELEIDFTNNSIIDYMNMLVDLSRKLQPAVNAFKTIISTMKNFNGDIDEVVASFKEKYRREKKYVRINLGTNPINNKPSAIVFVDTGYVRLRAAEYNVPYTKDVVDMIIKEYDIESNPDKVFGTLEEAKAVDFE